MLLVTYLRSVVKSFQALLTLMENATGKPVAGREEQVINEDISPIDMEEVNEVEI